MLTAGDQYEVALRGTHGGSQIINVLHVKLIDTQAASAFITHVQTFADAWKETWRGQQTSGFTWVDWRAQQVAGAGITYDSATCRRSGGDVYSAAFTGTLTGASTGAQELPSTLAVVCSLRTGQVGRSKNGRTFIGGWNTNKIVGNTITAGTVTALQTAVNTFLATYGSGGTDTHLEWGIFSRFIASGCKYVPAVPKPVLTHVQAGDQAGAHHVVTSATVNAVVAPMHRRKQGIGA